ncbi:MAG: hypothetical protein WCY37_04985 [Candidatus Dojkabacteria bacterium]
MDNNIPAGYNSDGRKGLDYIDLPERSIPIEQMLQEDGEWLAEQIGESVSHFTDLANKIQLRQEDWSTFWKVLNNNKLNIQTPNA